jgi:uncharacterized membrane protein YczE
MKEFIQGMYHKKNFTARLLTVIIAVIVMGFSLSWLVLVDMGTDPCTSMNLAISAKIGISLGNWQALLNCILFLFVIFLGRENIGFGTLANMFLVGYSLDFFSWLWETLGIPAYFSSMTVRVVVLFPALILFIFAASVYMDVQLGTSPYDAMSFIISKYLPKVSFRLVRIAYDLLVIVIAWAFGAKIGIVTIIMGFTLGPVISFVGKLLSRFIEVD